MVITLGQRRLPQGAVDTVALDALALEDAQDRERVIMDGTDVALTTEQSLPRRAHTPPRAGG